MHPHGCGVALCDITAKNMALSFSMVSYPCTSDLVFDRTNLVATLLLKLS